ncbi:MAG: hypothetical protein H6937_03665 [Burkholderiales bacterium]|nr:hypothetical protein [Burkholderiales bacterium]MDR4518680.1 tetratricopeptide repeat protein [Nitrosomonas sp.]
MIEWWPWIVIVGGVIGLFGWRFYQSYKISCKHEENPYKEIFVLGEEKESALIFGKSDSHEEEIKFSAGRRIKS